jgi:transmembrane sensor
LEKQFRDIEDFLEDSSFRHWVLHEREVRSLYWDAWLKANPDKAVIMYEAKELVLALEGNSQELEEEAELRMWDNISTYIDGSDSAQRDDLKSTSGITVRQYKRWLPSFEFSPLLVAVVLIFIALGAFVIVSFSDFTTDPTSPANAEVAETWTIKAVNRGEKKKFLLPDGSEVIMNSASELRYKNGFGEHHRELVLSGEAFFKVKLDSLLPFTVRSKDLYTVALGTSFIISAFPGVGDLEVKLFTGKVSVEYEKEVSMPKIYLTPGEKASLSNDDLKKTKFDKEKSLLWTQGVLYFDDMPLSEVIEVLERWYDVDISISGKGVENRTVSGEFRKDNLENVLTSIGYSTAFDFQIKNKNVTIKMK